MWYKYPTVILTLALFILGCNSRPTDNNLNMKFPLEVGQSIAVSSGTVNIGFDSVLYDGRCPIDPLILCVSPGQASIRLWAKKPGLDTDFVNVSIPGFTDTTSENHYPWSTIYDLKIRLRQLDPYPDTGDAPDQSEYMAWLEVRDYYTADGDDVIITDESPLGIVVDPYDIENFSINELNQATIRISYGGGCTEHDHYLFMSPAGFEYNDPPPKANLYIQHLAYGDACEALVHEDLTFDLNPIVSLYNIQNDGEGNPVLLTIYQFDGIDLFAADTATIQVAPGPLD